MEAKASVKTNANEIVFFVLIIISPEYETLFLDILFSVGFSVMNTDTISRDCCTSLQIAYSAL